MSRIGKTPVVIPPGVTVTRSDSLLTVKGPKGELSMTIHPDIDVHIGDGEVSVSRPSDIKEHRALHGMTRARIQNMVTGVTAGYSRNLELVGVGYRAEVKDGKLFLVVGYSHQIVLFPPAGITIKANSPISISVEGIDKQLVGHVAAKIRSFRPPEPYKGKGIKYENEKIRRKAGKTAKT
ncbi:MAG: 50S ribosomal protein L6 [Bacteroidota bacterium]|nr:50S ribosomal protein L6 [Bacteroidota bacterium]